MSKKSIIKETKEKTIQTKTKREATRGKAIRLHKYWKGIASTILDKSERRHFLNMMIDATVSAEEFSRRRGSNGGEKSSDEN